jgi:hypothetical protein
VVFTQILKMRIDVILPRGADDGAEKARADLLKTRRATVLVEKPLKASSPM